MKVIGHTYPDPTNAQYQLQRQAWEFRERLWRMDAILTAAVRERSYSDFVDVIPKYPVYLINVSMMKQKNISKLGYGDGLYPQFLLIHWGTGTRTQPCAELHWLLWWPCSTTPAPGLCKVLLGGRETLGRYISLPHDFTSGDEAT